MKDVVQNLWTGLVKCSQKIFLPLRLLFPYLFYQITFLKKLLFSFTLFLCNKSNSKLLNISLTKQNIYYTS